MDDFCRQEIFFDGCTFGEEPSDYKGDALLVFALDEQTIPFPVMNCSGVLPTVVLREFCL